MRWLLVGMMILSAGPSAWAITTGDLMAACNSAAGTSADITCNAYINGLGEGVLADQIAREDGTAICLPEKVSTMEIRKAIEAYIDSKNVAILKLPSGGAVAAALQATYPCRKSN